MPDRFRNRSATSVARLIFHLSPQNRSVDGTAVVSDRAASECGDDGRLTVLAVTARAGGVAVDEERLTADNGQRV